mmetsp:Transcript_410/g.1641  ORF Transcript_410/g.1641 Transcript_410/m.1641 type:complete len:300 (+) Transcript_410:800-1699(+)
MGSVIAKCSSSLISFRAPTSAQVTPGTVAKPSLWMLGCTHLSAASKSSFFTARATRDSAGSLSTSPAASPALARSAKDREMAEAAASFASALRSAATYPGVLLARWPTSTRPSSLRALVTTLSIEARAASSGIPTQTSLSNLPDLLSAGSMESGLLVAPMTTTCLARASQASRAALRRLASSVAPLSGAAGGEARSSMQDRSCATILLSISLAADSLFGASESISSMKMTEGAASRASENSCLSFCSLSPLMLLTTSGPAMEKMGTPASLATARASAVLPQPGGPWRRTPRGGSTPSQV